MTTTSHDSNTCCTPSYADTTSEELSASTVDDCCTPGTSTDPGAVLDEIRSEEIPADVAVIRSAGFRLLLETGRPVTVDDLIATTAIDQGRVAEIFNSVRARGRVEFDDEGRLIGIAGLSLTPSRHELTIGGDTRWTWCALDAVGILGALQATGTVKSSDPQTGDDIEIEFVDGSPNTDTYLFILGGHTEGNVRDDWCPRVNFFATRKAAESWVAANKLHGDIVGVSQISEEATQMWLPVVDPEARQIC